MFYYLIYNSTLSEYQDINKKLVTTLLYGSILYIILHAYLSITTSLFIQGLKPYFWLVYTLDVGSIGYLYTSTELPDDTSQSISKLRDFIKGYISNDVNITSSSEKMSTDINELLALQTQVSSNKINKHELSTELDNILKQPINSISSNNTTANNKIGKNISNGSDSGSDIGSIGDIDIQDFEASIN
jgi:hypothetical protein